MRHQKAGRKFGRNTSHRRAMFRNLAGNLVLHERIQTTDAKAKELRRIVERLITKAVRLGDDLTVDLSTVSDETKRAQIAARRVHAKREVAKFLPKRLTRTIGPDEYEDVDLIHKLFSDIAPRFVERANAEGQSGGGYTRVLKLGKRRGDNASMSIIEFVGYELPEKEVVEAVVETTEGEE